MVASQLIEYISWTVKAILKLKTLNINIQKNTQINSQMLKLVYVPDGYTRNVIKIYTKLRYISITWCNELDVAWKWHLQADEVIMSIHPLLHRPSCCDIANRSRDRPTLLQFMHSDAFVYWQQNHTIISCSALVIQKTCATPMIAERIEKSASKLKLLQADTGII